MADNSSLAPRPATLLKAVIAAFVAAAAIFVLFVLPAEYGIDPTGAGKALGLTRLAAVEGTQPAPAAPTPEQSGQPATPAAQTVYAHPHDGPPKKDVIHVQLKPGEEVEYKAQIAAGEPFFYSWSIPAGKLYYDFHGEPTEGNYPKDYFLSYGEGEAGSGQGSFVAPFTGHHGWYWLNITEEPVTIELTLEGYYDSHSEVYRGQNY